MTVRINKPAINLREELADLRKPTGIAGEEMLRAETPQEQFNLIGAGRRNLVINGAMQVAQRGTSFTNVTTSWGADRFIAYVDSMGTFDISNTSDTPSGFSNSLKWSCNTADASPSGNDEAFIQTILEAQNLQHLEYGSADAKTITVSFWVKSSETGSFGLWLYAIDGTRAFDTSYTISSANTWEKKTITVVGDASGTINNDNGAGLYVRWMLGTAATGTMSNSWKSPSNTAPTGSVNIQGAVGRTFYLTGVQLEVGKVATPFEHRSYGEELALCQRYYYRYGGNGRENLVGGSNTNTGYFTIQFPTTMRTAPSFSNGGGFTVNNFSSAGTPSDINGGLTSVNSAEFQTVGGVTYTLGNALLIYETSTNSGNLKFDAEL